MARKRGQKTADSGSTEKKPKTETKRQQRAAAASNLTQETFVEYFREYSAARTKIEEATAAARAILKRAASVGINTKMLAKARENQRLDRDKVEADMQDLARYHAWLGLPVGTQAEMFGDAGDAPKKEVIDEQRIWEAGEAGLAAGKAGKNRTDNPHAPGSELYQAWDRAYIAGQETIIEQMDRTKPKLHTAEDYSKAAEAGRRAAKAGKTLADNPHDEGAPLHKSWTTGFEDQTERTAKARGQKLDDQQAAGTA